MKVSGLTPASAANLTDQFHAIQGTSDVSLTPAQIFTLFYNNAGSYPATASLPGFVASGAQSFPAGAKTFTDVLNIFTGSRASQIYFGTATGQGTLQADTTNTQLGWGYDFNGTVYTARQTSSAMVSPRNGNIIFFSNSGLTIGNTFTPIDRGRVGGNGWQIGASGTPLTQVIVYSQTLTPTSVAANSSAEQTFTVTGLATTDKLEVNGPSGVVIVNKRASAANTLALTFLNPTGSPATPPSGTYTIVAIRS